MKGVAFLSGLFCVLCRPSCTTRQVLLFSFFLFFFHHRIALRWEHWDGLSRGVTPRGCFNCFFSMSYQLSGLFFYVCSQEYREKSHHATPHALINRMILKLSSFSLLPALYPEVRLQKILSGSGY